jgi:hypothetical protein
MYIGNQRDIPRNGIVHALKCDTCGDQGEIFVSRFDQAMRCPPVMKGWRRRDGLDECPACVASICDRIANELLAAGQYN